MIHLYGFILGLAMVIGVYLIQLQAKKQNVNLPGFDYLIWAVLLGGVIGARVYHVITDYYLYQYAFWDIFKIWQGGLGIIGAVIGGVIAVWGWLKINKSNQIFGWLKINKINKQLNLLTILDLAVFGLPVAQAIGRWGNFFNQELYGLPTSLPWGIYIDFINRLPGYENFSHFHPLFFYEMVLMLVFAGLVWWMVRQERFSGFSIGSGKWFLFYIFYYSFIRFWLDFIRIDKMQFFNTGLCINQVFLIIVMIIIGRYWWMVKRFRKKQ